MRQFFGGSIGWADSETPKGAAFYAQLDAEAKAKADAAAVVESAQRAADEALAKAFTPSKPVLPVAPPAAVETEQNPESETPPPAAAPDKKKGK